MKEQQEKFCTTETDLAIELKVVLEDFYSAKITRDENSVLIRFFNGQKFKIEIKELL